MKLKVYFEVFSNSEVLDLNIYICAVHGVKLRVNLNGRICIDKNRTKFHATTMGFINLEVQVVSVPELHESAVA